MICNEKESSGFFWLQTEWWQVKRQRINGLFFCFKIAAQRELLAEPLLVLSLCVYVCVHACAGYMLIISNPPLQLGGSVRCPALWLNSKLISLARGSCREHLADFKSITADDSTTQTHPVRYYDAFWGNCGGTCSHFPTWNITRLRHYKLFVLFQQCKDVANAAQPSAGSLQLNMVDVKHVF